MITEKTITDSLNRLFAGNSRYKLANAFIFKSDWESDFFVQKDNGYSYEFEVKISRSDFFNDKKKVDKHLILSTGRYISKTGRYDRHPTTNELFRYEECKEVIHNLRPNKFFYVVPENMISVSEIPDYAGLYYYGGPYAGNYGLTKIKDAPFIHKEKLSFEAALCRKFYYYWMDARQEIVKLKSQLK